MARFYVSDQQHVSFRYESGTYAVPSGVNTWIGLVTDHSVDEDMGVIPVRYAGTNSRLTQQFLDGPQTFTNSITFHPQNFRMLKFVLGSCVDGGSPSPYTHNYLPNHNNANSLEIPNLPLSSFSITDAKNTGIAGSNFIRTFSGCVANTFSLSVNEGEPASVELGYVAQSVVYTSGAVPGVSGIDTTTPFMWRHSQVHMPSGTVLTELKNLTLSINNNLETPHYVDNNRFIGQPIPTNLDVELELGLNATAEFTKSLYDQFFIGGSVTNLLIALSASTGSKELFVTLSGAKLVDMDAPSPSEGVQEQTLTFQAGSVFAQEFNDFQFGNAWSGPGF